MLAEQFLQQLDFTALRNVEELLFNRRQRINAIDFNRLRIPLHPPADCGDSFRPGRGEQ